MTMKWAAVTARCLARIANKVCVTGGIPVRIEKERAGMGIVDDAVIGIVRMCAGMEADRHRCGWRWRRERLTPRCCVIWHLPGMFR